MKLAEARQNLLDRVSSQKQCENVALDDALGRVVAQDYVSNLDIPPTDNSAMDGFAIAAADARKDAVLQISQRIPAGSKPIALKAGTAARIFTGGVMPTNADAVVIQENCQFDDKQVRILKTVDASENVRSRGQDINSGARVVDAGKKLTAVDLGLLASIGIDTVSCFKTIRIAVFSTGDELAEPGSDLQPGQIYNSNRPLLKALCRKLGYKLYDCGVIEDTLSATKNALSEAAQNADFIISSGGVSVGEEDHVKPAVEAIGRLDLWKIKMKPGKPVAFGTIADTPFLGLPGNPVSAFVVFQLIGLTLLQKRQGQAIEVPIEYPVIAEFDKELSSREEYIRVKLSQQHDGSLSARSFPNLSSGVMSSLSWADGLVRQNADSEIAKGDRLKFLPLREGLL